MQIVGIIFSFFASFLADEPVAPVPAPAFIPQEVMEREVAPVVIEAIQEVEEALEPEPVKATAPIPVPVPKPVAAPVKVTPASVASCHSGYSGCLNPNASDYDCAGGSGNGPYYTGRVEVYGSDPFDLDRDGDGVGCD